MLKKLKKIALAATLVAIHAVGQAEDIDLFAGAPVAADVPNVLIVIDNTANWSSAFAAEMAALAATIEGLETDTVRLGFMMYTETGSGNDAPDGTYVRAAVRTMSETNKTLYKALVNSFDVTKDKGNNAKAGLAMSEVDRYFSAAEAYAGANKAKRDYSGNHVPSLNASNAVYALAGNALASSDAETYQSPVNSACQKNFVIYLSNGKYNANTSDNTTATSHLSAVGGSTTTVPLSPSGYEADLADEWARYMASKTSNSVVTYVIDVVPTNAGQYSNDYKALLQSMAAQGKGAYFNVGSAGAGDLGAKLQAAFGSILSQIQSENSAFASASLPVSVNTQGTYLNQVFIGMFRPAKEPRWHGNLKQYQFRADADANGTVVALRLVDKTNNQDAINPLNGFIDPCAQSFWSTADTYWPSGYPGNCLLTGLNDVRSNSPDGEIVEKGAGAQRLRAVSGATGASARNVTTCSGCGDDSALESLSTGNASIAALGAADSTEQGNLVSWARGQNVDDEVIKGTPDTITMTKGTDAMRPSVHGDVVHSRPLAIDYGGSTGVVVFYGGNDGMLRAIKGGKFGSTDGDELWSFVAPEHYSKFKRLRSNSPFVSFPNVTGTPTPTPKDYFFDGPIGFYSDGSTKWIYPTMRRGGSVVYAFDVSTPAAPTLKWKRDETDLVNIGQTWSEPKVVKVAGEGSGATPVLIMGGGYDPCEDQDAVPNTLCSSPKGNRVFVLNASTGEVLRTMGTGTGTGVGGDGDAILRSIAADVTVVDSDSDGLVDVAYAADTGANLYRINIGTAAPGSWTITKIAALGCSSGECGRKFLHAPEVVTGTAFNTVLVGSGNRESPLMGSAANGVNNAFFMIKDDLSATPTVITTSNLVAMNPNTAPTTEQQDALALSTNKGWYLAFGESHSTKALDHDREQVVTSAVVFAGVVYFSTHQPVTPTACGANLGTARGYAVNYLDASTPGGLAKFSVFAGGGLPPSPVTGVVTVSLTNSDDTTATNPDGTTKVTNVPFIIGGGAPPPGPPGCGISGLSPCLVTVDPSPVRRRTFWYIQQ